MRVSTSMLYQQSASWIESAQSQMYTTQQQISSGKRILAPSDDPAGAAAASRLNSQSAQQTQFLSSVDTATQSLNAADPVLNNISDTILSLRTLAQGAASGTLSDSDLASYVAQAQDLRTQLLSDANTESGGRYLFAGQATTTQPFQDTGAGVSYNGSDTAMTISVTPSASLPVGVTGDRLTNAGGVVDSSHTDLFTAVDNVISELQNGDTTGLSNSLGELDFQRTNVVNLRAELGSHVRTCTQVKTVLQASQDNVTAALSAVQDTDIAKAAVDLATEQNAYQAASAVAGSMSQLSLLNYLK